VVFDRGHLLVVALAVVSALAGLALSVWLRPAAPAPIPGVATQVVGDLREDVVLPDRDGTPRRLSEWDGRLVVLNFWASWCGPCREEMPLLDRLHARRASDGVSVIGVAAEEAGPALAFLATNPVAYPILVNPPGDAVDVALRFGNTRNVLPYNVLIGRDGRILATRVGNFDEAGLERWIAPFL
jgi:thiol-disulfide isomerase/thioredoxin